MIRANRETIGLVVAATAATFALAYAVRSHPTPAPVPPSAEARQEWTGQLADVAPSALERPAPFKSADLVVPKAQLALPPLVPALPRAKRPCDDATCAKVPTPPVRRVVARTNQPPKVEKEASLLTTLNPLNHVPSLSTLGKPFSYAGDVMTGWIKRF